MLCRPEQNLFNQDPNNYFELDNRWELTGRGLADRLPIGRRPLESLSFDLNRFGIPARLKI